jgi:PAS domain-containing protein
MTCAGNLVDINAELRHREAEAQVVLEAVVEGVYAVDHERNIRYLNPQAARLLGIEPGGRHWQVLRRRAQALRCRGLDQSAHARARPPPARSCAPARPAARSRWSSCRPAPAIARP